MIGHERQGMRQLDALACRICFSLLHHMDPPAGMNYRLAATRHSNMYLQPILDESSPVHAWFPSREWALRIPAFIVVLGISAIGLFLGARIIHDGSEENRLSTKRKEQ